MKLPLSGDAALWLALVLGAAFGWLLHRGGVTNYNVIVNQFRFRDFTVLKVMFTAIIVGGVGVLALTQTGHAQFHIKPANMLGVTLGAALFGVGMVLYGYCPGTGVAAIATGSLHALVGVIGMLAGAVLYALSFAWVETHIQKVAALGKLRLPEVTGIPDWGWFAILAAIAGVVFWLIETKTRSTGAASRQ
ncbi:MAG: YeeE/YedE family protein [Verrucomicrobia bacterium]|nr:YeeE/YedE family protein [Verrucomicrobiota bacterium]